MARQGTVVAHQGRLDFAYPDVTAGGSFRAALTGQVVPLRSPSPARGS